MRPRKGNPCVSFVFDSLIRPPSTMVLRSGTFTEVTSCSVPMTGTVLGAMVRSPMIVSLICEMVRFTSPSGLMSGTTSSFSTTSRYSAVEVILPLLPALPAKVVVVCGYGIF